MVSSSFRRHYRQAAGLACLGASSLSTPGMSAFRQYNGNIAGWRLLYLLYRQSLQAASAPPGIVDSMARFLLAVEICFSLGICMTYSRRPSFRGTRDIDIFARLASHSRSVSVFCACGNYCDAVRYILPVLSFIICSGRADSLASWNNSVISAFPSMGVHVDDRQFDGIHHVGRISSSPAWRKSPTIPHEMADWFQFHAMPNVRALSVSILPATKPMTPYFARLPPVERRAIFWKSREYSHSFYW